MVKKQFFLGTLAMVLALSFGVVLVGCTTLNRIKPISWHEPVPEDQQCVLYYYSQWGFLDIESIDQIKKYVPANSVYPKAYTSGGQPFHYI
ncbi:MAG: hypothetical protein LBR93_09255 [Treponema sp.]|nr:hypothetical protein [Treponema sp.]